MIDRPALAYKSGRAIRQAIKKDLCGRFYRRIMRTPAKRWGPPGEVAEWLNVPDSKSGMRL